MCTAGAARTVLSDCRRAHALLEDCDDAEYWRIHWVAAISLVRAVGHVLRNIDGKDSRIKRAASAAFDEWKQRRRENAIFWEFIEEERNLLLKEYRFGVDLRDEIPIIALSATGVDSDPKLFSLDDNLYRPVHHGQWQSEDARDVYAEAIAWWEEQLGDIERRASKTYK